MGNSLACLHRQGHLIRRAKRDTVQSILMPHWKITLSYDGGPYNGWQIQPQLPTVQGALADVIRHITGEEVLPQGSGRTDTGVHALAQVATFALAAPIPAANLHRALNRALPPSIRVLSVELAPPDFHARHSALRKTYEYRILPGDTICSPMLAPYVWACRLDLDLPTLQQAASQILGTHDFTSFAASDPDLATRRAPFGTSDEGAAFDADYFAELDTQLVTDTEAERAAANHPSEVATTPTPDRIVPDRVGAIRTIDDSAWHRQDDLLIYRITGSGFLHHMVRNLVGTFVEAAAGRSSSDAIPTILAARNRSAAGPTAPARGLFLIEVDY
jgi:tRNA pseudouridine38-40 synthase